MTSEEKRIMYDSSSLMIAYHVLGSRDYHQVLALLGPVYVTPQEIVNAAPFLPLDLPSTPIRYENEAFSKRSPNGINLT